jgi:hypothetical protein
VALKFLPRSDRLIYLGVDPIVNSVRSDHEFQSLAHKIGLDSQ